MIHHRYADRKRVVESEANVADAVADEDNVYDRIGHSGGDCIIGRRHDQPTSVVLPTLQQGERNLRSCRFRKVTHRGTLRDPN
jgi:hypothetical protein